MLTKIVRFIFENSLSSGTTTYSKDTTIGNFLNGEYLTSEKYLTEEQVKMIEDNTIWYLGAVDNGVSYKLAKYTNEEFATNVEAKIGLLRYGELMAGKLNYTSTIYWTLTRNSSNNLIMRVIGGLSDAIFREPTEEHGIRPAFNLKSNVIITSGTGTLNDPFTLSGN